MPLKKIQEILKNEEFECSFLTATDHIPYDRLTVLLGLDAKERKRTLEISANQQRPSPGLSLPKSSTIPYRIQFRIPLPFIAPSTTISQVASLILFLNQFIDLPGFELHEVDGSILYRYVWLIHSTSIDSILTLNLVGSIILNLSLFSESIETLATGKITFNELLSKIEKFYM